MSTYPRIEVNGIAMDDSAQRWAMAADQPLRGLPGRRATSVIVPGRSGVIWPASDTREVGAFSVSLIVLGYGSTTDLQVADLQTSLDALNYLFDAPVLTIDYFASATKIYRALGRCIASTQPQNVNQENATVTYAIELPDSCWRAQNVSSLNFGTATGQQEVTFMAGSSATITDSKFLFTGPFTRLTLTANTTGQYLQIPTVTAGHTCLIDCGLQTATLIGAPDFNGTGVDMTGLVTPGGPGSAVSWLNLVPKANAVDPTDRKVYVQAATVGAATGYQWYIQGRAAY